MNRREAEHLAHNLIAWRDPSDSKITGGAQARDYRAAGLAYGAKNANFDSVEELRQVMGFSLEQYRILAPNLTVHGASASPRDLTLAPPLARAALELKMAPMAASTLRTHNMGGPFYRIQVHGLEDTGPAMEILIKTGRPWGGPTEPLPAGCNGRVASGYFPARYRLVRCPDRFLLNLPGSRLHWLDWCGNNSETVGCMKVG